MITAIKTRFKKTSKAQISKTDSTKCSNLGNCSKETPEIDACGARFNATPRRAMN